MNDFEAMAKRFHRKTIPPRPNRVVDCPPAPQQTADPDLIPVSDAGEAFHGVKKIGQYQLQEGAGTAGGKWRVQGRGESKTFNSRREAEEHAEMSSEDAAAPFTKSDKEQASERLKEETKGQTLGEWYEKEKKKPAPADDAKEPKTDYEKEYANATPERKKEMREQTKSGQEKANKRETERAFTPGSRDAKESKIEAYGVKGMSSTKWRKEFASHEELEKWADKNDAEIQGVRKLEESQ